MKYLMIMLKKKFKESKKIMIKKKELKRIYQKKRKIFKKKKNKIHLKNNNFVELCGIINLTENTGGEYK